MKDFHLSIVICFCFHLCSYFSDPLGSWVMLCFHTFYTPPKAAGSPLYQVLYFFVRPTFCSLYRLVLSVNRLIFYAAALLSCFSSSITMPNPLLLILYFFSSLFLVPYPHGLFQHSIILLTLPLSLSTFLDSYFFHPGCCVAHWLPFHLAPLNFSVTRSARARIVSFCSVMY